jgi:hypothetical protein
MQECKAIPIIQMSVVNSNLKDLELVLRQLQDVTSVIIGETIDDEFVFCKEVQRGQNRYKAVISERTVLHQGGSLAVAKSLSAFCNVKLVTDTANNSLAVQNNNLQIIPLSHGNPLIKRRFLNKRSAMIFYEHVFPSARKMNPLFKSRLLNELRKKNELVLVYDFGFSTLIGAVLKAASQLLNTKHLSFNSQLNTIRSTPRLKEQIQRSNIWFMNEVEAQTRCQTNKANKSFYPERFGQYHETENVVVTLALKGMSWYSNARKCCHVSSPSVKGNRWSIGMGDIAMALTALTYYVTQDAILSVKLGACAGAAKAGLFGHERNIYPEDIKTLWAKHFSQ